MIFLSYCHAQSSEADKLEAFLKENHVQVLRDTREMKKNDSISDFMSRIGRSDYAILLISDAYLRSYYCLHEAFLAFQNRHLRNIIPIIFPDADCLSPGSGSGYIRYWYDQMKELENTLDNFPPQLAVEHLKKLRQIENYCINFSVFLEYIQDNNSICSCDTEEWTEQTYECLCDRMLSREIRANKVSPAKFVPTPSIRGIISGEIVLSIDFGTSYTLASVLDKEGKNHLIPDQHGNRILASTIEFTESGHYHIGSNGPNVLRNIKRLIGSRNTVEANGQTYSVKLLIAMILRSVIRNAEEYLNIPIRQVLMALPVDFSLLQKKILKECATLAGVSVARFIPESSIEALLPLAESKEDCLSAFIDMGGGTLDLSVADIGSELSDIRYTDGLRDFGSADFDQIMENLLRQKLLTEHSISATHLDTLAEQAKRELGAHPSVTVSYYHYSDFGNIEKIPLVITMEEFQNGASDLIDRFDKILAAMKKELRFQSYDSEDLIRKLQYIYLTGQGTKLHILRQRIAKYFPDSTIVDTYQEGAVIQGLSLQNQVFCGLRDDILLLNALPSSLYLSINGKKEQVLEPNTTIPTYKIHTMEIPFNPDSPDTVFPIEVYEVTNSLQVQQLFHTSLQFIPGYDYELIIDVDADFNGLIRIIQTDSRSPVPEYTIDGHTFKDYYTWVNSKVHPLLYSFEF